MPGPALCSPADGLVAGERCAGSYLLGERSSSAGFEVPVDGVSDDVADSPAVPVGDPLDRCVGLVVDSEVDPLGVAGAAGQGGPAGVPAGQCGRIEAGLGLVGQPSLVVGV